ncbi:phosphotransferase [Nonomuraea guangzhouensis]|uniref:Phosphotransferase n=1 Tax=Nonomuraea guangzhouensis TaxID=1291555 RepID=A0ABW4GX77_9ACTN|nr:phosphotransferase [Nonomuraea guangzhouensis]
MTLNTFSKPYSTRKDLEWAVAHHTWLAEHAKSLQLPPLVAVHANRLELGFVDGRHAVVADVPTVAAALGQAHADVWASDLHRALLTHAHPMSGGHELADFASPRMAALHRRCEAGLISVRQMAAVQPLLSPHPATPAAFYKDTNPRNVLITSGGPVMVDLDDLTLAPFGYDLAKLLVALAMTDGPLPPETYTAALSCYNLPLTHAGLPSVPIDEFLGYAELHHLLTLPYLGKGGYRHPWSTVRPTPEDLK